MKKIWFSVLLGAWLLFAFGFVNLANSNHAVFFNQVFAAPTPGDDGGDGDGGGGSGGNTNGLNLNFGEVAKDKEIAGTANYDPTDSQAGFSALLTQILNVIVAIAFIILLIMFLWGGLEWITAGGDKSKIEKARNRITQSIVGILVLASTIAVFAMVQKFLNVDILEFVSS